MLSYLFFLLSSVPNVHIFLGGRLGIRCLCWSCLDFLGQATGVCGSAQGTVTQSRLQAIELFCRFQQRCLQGGNVALAELSFQLHGGGESLQLLLHRH